MSVITKPSLEEILELLPKTTSLTYVDYNENLDEAFKEMQADLHSNTSEKVDEYLDGSYWEQEADSVKRILKTLRKELQSKFDLSKSESKEIIEEHADYLRDEVYNRDDSNIISSLLSNTNKIVTFYDTGLEICAGSWQWSSSELTKNRKKVKRKLGINGTFKYDDYIDQMLLQASYGGRLVIYFHLDYEYFFTYDEDNDFKSITFENAHIAVIDTYQGSGDNTFIPKHSFTLPFNRENVFIDECITYNYTYSVCGMSSNWCDDTKVTLAKESTGEEIEKSSLNAALDKENDYIKTYKSGACTYGDINIGRHREVTYINEYPCRNECTKCRTRWID